MAGTLQTFAEQSDLDRAARALCRRCAVMRGVHKRIGTPELRHFDADFAGLAKIITGQQLSAQSAAAIWARVRDGIRPFTPRAVLRSGAEGLASFGQSKPKIKTLLMLAEAVETKDLDFKRLNASDDEDVIRQLTALHGIGPWTADIYLLFALRRADAFPGGDLALQLAVQRLFARDVRPTSDELVAIAERWRPWRGAAAHLLWAEYATAPRATGKVAMKSKANP